jgi:hypothetical protein
MKWMSLVQIPLSLLCGYFKKKTKKEEERTTCPLKTIYIFEKKKVEENYTTF